ncbi:MAG: penicillin-binding transpeptidase domain-containing protein [Microthrixaceae bacterium]|nr:penicillin-binding transpeptidase domain-containing protein [Microthrixaceae bacterium]
MRIAADAGRLGTLSEDDPSAEGRFVELLAEATGVDQLELIDALSASDPEDRWVELIPEATPEAAQRATESLLEAGLLSALVLEDTSVRVHPSGDSGLRVVGTLGPEGPGPGAGVEAALDGELSGTDGVRSVQKSPKGEVIAGSDEVTTAPSDGASVWLTLDRNLQYEVEQVLLRGAEAAGAAGGVVVLGRPDTGELLAVAGVERDTESGRMRLAESPKPFADAYQAGSVFKLVPVSAAIDDGVVSLDTELSVPPKITLYDRTFSDYEEHGVESMSVRDIVAHSSNVGTIKIAQELGSDRLYEELRDFGFGRLTGVAAPAESAGLVPEVGLWNGPDIAASAIGTLQSATAVQLWAAYNVIANNGEYVAPRLVKRVQRADGSELQPEPGERRQVIAPAAAEQVEEALRAVVTEGTASDWSIPGFPAAAKTGTSRMPDPERSDGTDGYLWADGRYHYLNVFAGYLPADAPELSITVLLEDTAEGLTGSSGAGPVFSALARLGIRELGIAPRGADEGSAVPTRLRAEPATVADEDPSARTTSDAKPTDEVASGEDSSEAVPPPGPDDGVTGDDQDG